MAPFRKPTKNAGQNALIFLCFNKIQIGKVAKLCDHPHLCNSDAQFAEPKTGYKLQHSEGQASSSQVPWVTTCVAKKQPQMTQMQVEEISFSPFSRTSIEKKMSVHLMCLVCLHQLRTHLRKHEQKNCCIRSLSKLSLLTVT